MRVTLGLNLFVGQLIGIVGLLIVVCVGVVSSFYYTNLRVFTNENLVMKEEIERNQLVQVNMLVALARQEEKGFYAEQDVEDAYLVIKHLDDAITKTNTLIKIVPKANADHDTISFYPIVKLLQTYRSQFSKSLALWQKRGFSRETGVSRKLRTTAYDGLRNRLAHHNTQVLRNIMDRIRWLEHEFFIYWNQKHLNQIYTLIGKFHAEIKSSQLKPDLSQLLGQNIDSYHAELKRLEQAKHGSDHEAVEKAAINLIEVLNTHTIFEFKYLLRTLLYYEMEYRELGQQPKHIAGVNETLTAFRQSITEAMVANTDKQKLFHILDEYSAAFIQLIWLDAEIKKQKTAIIRTIAELEPMIQQAAEKEQHFIDRIRAETATNNQFYTRINLIAMSMMVVIAIILVIWMVRRLGGKVTRIGETLAKIAEGDLIVTSTSLPEHKRDELDWIAHHVSTVAASLSVAIQDLRERNVELELISNKLAKYLSPQVYKSIFSGRQSVSIQSKRKKLTVFFSDIVNFTNTTDTMESEDLTALLNDYLNEMSKIALTHGGTIDKFIGDAVMIFFGDPETQGEQEDAVACVSMAITMRQRISELRLIWENDNGYSKPFQIRIGIDTGYCTVGNFGSEERMDYTIIGSHVNLASRLEHNASPGEILISHETYALIKDRIHCNVHNTIQVKGLAEPVRTYQVNDLHEKLSNQQIRFHTTGNGFNILVDGDSMTNIERDSLAETMQGIAQQLRQFN